MIRHIVMWKLKAADRDANARKIKEQLESLRGKVPGMSHIEVGIARQPTESADVVLLSEHEDWVSLDTYQQHPEHLAMKDFIASIRERREVCDYEV
jgi:hypothetical protein